MTKKLHRTIVGLRLDVGQEDAFAVINTLEGSTATLTGVGEARIEKIIQFQAVGAIVSVVHFLLLVDYTIISREESKKDEPKDTD